MVQQSDSSESIETLVKWLDPHHKALKRRFSWYHNWHSTGHYRQIHTSTALVALLAAIVSITSGFTTAPTAYAATYTPANGDVWCDSADVPSDLTDLTIDSGVTLTLGGDSGNAVNGSDTDPSDACSYEVNGWTVTGSGTLTVNGTLKIDSEVSGSSGFGIGLDFANVTVGATGSIDAAGLGFAAGTSQGVSGDGPGGGGGDDDRGGGGGHGGDGATAIWGGDAGVGGSAYGSSIAPVTLGSGGGGGNNCCGASGGAGGGAIRIDVSGTLNLISGSTVTANGRCMSHGAWHTTAHSTTQFDLPR